MFGHEDGTGQDNNGVAPAPDDALGTTVQPSTGDDSQSAPALSSDTGSSTQDYIMTDAPSGTTPAPSTDGLSDDTGPTTAEPAASDTPAQPPTQDLLDIKQKALQQLTPLVGHLDQTPEEEFRTTMMMIQASDNENLIKKAYEAAERITDEKTRAQALLDVVNEINYFTQRQGEI